MDRSLCKGVQSVSIKICLENGHKPGRRPNSTASRLQCFLLIQVVTLSMVLFATFRISCILCALRLLLMDMVRLLSHGGQAAIFMTRVMSELKMESRRCATSWKHPKRVACHHACPAANRSPFASFLGACGPLQVAAALLIMLEMSEMCSNCD